MSLAADSRAPGGARLAVDRITAGLRPLQRFDARLLVSDLVALAAAGARQRTDAVTVSASVGQRFRVEVVATQPIPRPPPPLVALLNSVASSWTAGDRLLWAETEFEVRLEQLGQADLLQRVRSGDDRARGQLVVRHLGLGVAIARSFEQRGVDLEDLIAVAELGLVRASLKFDPDRGVKFSTYATHVVTGDLRQFFRDQAWAVGMPRSLRERSRLVTRTREAMERRLGRPATDVELADELRVDEAAVREATAASLGFRAATFEPGSHRPQIRLGYSDPGLAYGAERTDLRQALDRLDPQDREILCRYFIDDQTQKEIAGQLDLSQVQVSRRISANLSRLREHLGGSPGCGPGPQVDARTA